MDVGGEPPKNQPYHRGHMRGMGPQAVPEGNQVKFGKGRKMRQKLADRFRETRTASDKLPSTIALHDYDKFAITKLFPGAYTSSYFANGHSLGLPVRVSNGTYI